MNGQHLPGDSRAVRAEVTGKGGVQATGCAGLTMAFEEELMSWLLGRRLGFSVNGA